MDQRGDIGSLVTTSGYTINAKPAPVQKNSEWKYKSVLPLLFLFKTFEPCHEKTCLRDFQRLKPACSATQTSESREIAKKETRDIILSWQRTTNGLI